LALTVEKDGGVEAIHAIAQIEELLRVIEHFG
jgi:hypothetical protein